MMNKSNNLKRICMFVGTGRSSELLFNFNPLQSFCQSLKNCAEIHVLTSGFMSNNTQNIDNLFIHDVGGFNIFIHALLAVRYVLKNKNFDIYMNLSGHASLGFLAVISALITRKKSIVRVTGDEVKVKKINKQFIKYIIYCICEKISLKYSNYVVIVAKSFQVDLIKKGANPNKLCVISQGVDTEFFKPMKHNRNAEPIILFVANRLTREKNIKDLILVAKKLEKTQNVFFHVISGSVGLKEAKEYAKMHKVNNIKFIGFAERNQLPYYYNYADVLIVTSISEALPNVILEAMACSTPVIATDVGGIKKLVKNDITGKLVKVHDIQGFKDAIIELVTNPEKREKMGKNARKFIIQNYSIDSVKDKYKQLMNDVLKS